MHQTGPPEAFNQYFEDLIKFLNEFSTKLLGLGQSQKVKPAMEILKYCIQWTKPGRFGQYPVQYNLTLNTLGTTYK